LPPAGIDGVASDQGLHGIACGGVGANRAVVVSVRANEGLGRGRARKQTSEQRPDRED
jgi:hypothetical protein